MPAQINYNNILLDINQVRCHRKAMYSGPNYIYTRHIYHCTAVYNPAATAYKSGALVLVNPGPSQAKVTDNVFAPQTDVAVRHVLMQPRKPFVYTVGNTVVLKSPYSNAPGMTADDNNGPMPLDCNVTAIHGTKTFLVEFLLQTDINEMRFGQVSKQLRATDLFLSDVYTQEDDIDNHFFNTRTTRGHAVYSTTFLQALDEGAIKINGKFVSGDPDVFRKGIMENHPVPLNCQRENLHFRVDENNNTLDYSFVDREKAVNIIFNNIPEIRCTQSVYMDNGDNLRFSMDDNSPGAPGMQVLTPFATTRRQFRDPEIDFDSSSFGIGALPSVSMSLEIDVFGNRNATRSNLITAGNFIMRSQIETAGLTSNIFGFLGAMKTRTDLDLAGRHAHIFLDGKIGGLTVFLRSIFTNRMNLLTPNAGFFGKDYEIERVFSNDSLVDNPVPPGDQTSRGTFTDPIAVRRPL